MELPVWTGAVPSSGPSQHCGTGSVGVKNAGFALQLSPKGVENTPKRSRKHSQEEQELWEAGGALLSRIPVISSAGAEQESQIFPFFVHVLAPALPWGARHAQGPA